MGCAACAGAAVAYVSLVLLACIARGPGIFVLLYVLYGESSVYEIVLRTVSNGIPPLPKLSNYSIINIYNARIPSVASSTIT